MQNVLLGLANLYRKTKQHLLLSQKLLFNYKQGQWVHVKYDYQCHLGVEQNVNYTDNLVSVRLLKPCSDIWWQLEPQIDAVWYIESDILGHAKHEPVMD